MIISFQFPNCSVRQQFCTTEAQRPQRRVYFGVLGGVGIVFPCKISVITVSLWCAMDDQLNGYDLLEQVCRAQRLLNLGALRRGQRQ